MDFGDLVIFFFFFLKIVDVDLGFCFCDEDYAESKSSSVFLPFFFGFLLVLERAHDYGYEFHEIGIFFCDPVQLDFNPKNQNFFRFWDMRHVMWLISGASKFSSQIRGFVICFFFEFNGIC